MFMSQSDYINGVKDVIFMSQLRYILILYLEKECRRQGEYKINTIKRSISGFDACTSIPPCEDPSNSRSTSVLGTGLFTASTHQQEVERLQETEVCLITQYSTKALVPRTRNISTN